MDNSAQQSGADDQEQDLANVLAGVSEQVQQMGPADGTTTDTTIATDNTPPTDGQPAADDNTAPITDNVTSGLQFEETPLPQPIASGDTDAASTTALPSVADMTASNPTISSLASTTHPSGLTPELDSIKKDALSELRPLVDKLDLPAEEKFDTLLLVIRSTDDKSLLGSAHEAAKAIEDENKKAQALLDVIKEIDYFANQSA